MDYWKVSQKERQLVGSREQRKGTDWDVRKGGLKAGW